MQSLSPVLATIVESLVGTRPIITLVYGFRCVLSQGDFEAGELLSEQLAQEVVLRLRRPVRMIVHRPHTHLCP